MDIRKFFSAFACSPSPKYHVVDVDLEPALSSTDSYEGHPKSSYIPTKKGMLDLSHFVGGL